MQEDAVRNLRERNGAGGNKIIVREQGTLGAESGDQTLAFEEFMLALSPQHLVYLEMHWNRLPSACRRRRDAWFLSHAHVLFSTEGSSIFLLF